MLTIYKNLTEGEARIFRTGLRCHGRVEEPLGSCFGIMMFESNSLQTEENISACALWIKAGFIGNPTGLEEVSANQSSLLG